MLRPIETHLELGHKTIFEDMVMSVGWGWEWCSIIGILYQPQGEVPCVAAVRIWSSLLL